MSSNSELFMLFEGINLVTYCDIAISRLNYLMNTKRFPNLGNPEETISIVNSSLIRIYSG
jgi:hypothetical protein